MEHSASTKKQKLKVLKTELKKLQVDLSIAQKLAGVDEYIDVKVITNQSRFELVKTKNEPDKAFGHFYLQLSLKAEQMPVFIPLSLASGKKTTGFMYQIEGTAEGLIANANVEAKGDGVTQITIGTILYAKIPAGKTATFTIKTTIKGQKAKTYKIIINRINYKLAINDARYKQYFKEIVSDSLKFS